MLSILENFLAKDCSLESHNIPEWRILPYLFHNNSASNKGKSSRFPRAPLHLTSLTSRVSVFLIQMCFWRWRVSSPKCRKNDTFEKKIFLLSLGKHELIYLRHFLQVHFDTSQLCLLCFRSHRGHSSTGSNSFPESFAQFGGKPAHGSKSRRSHTMTDATRTNPPWWRENENGLFFLAAKRATCGHTSVSRPVWRGSKAV